MKSRPFYFSIVYLLSIIQLSAQEKPNIILIFPDNLGAGEVASYGGARGVPTPNIDRIGQEGMRLTNFNVEYTCVPSRIAILTGRYATRTGENYFQGIPLWERTIAEGLKAEGYTTGLFGKYDIGGPNWQGVREPMAQGFDEWYGIPGTSHVAQFPTMEGFDPSKHPVPYIWEGEMGSSSKKVKPYTPETRRTLDREAAERTISFIQKSTADKKPFFVYYAMTQLHFPALPHPDKAGSTGAGDMGDSMADVDYNVGLIMAELERLGIAENTLLIWCSDNGAEMRRPWRGSPGPWRGFYNSAMEGGVRTPCVIRWPGRISPGQVSNEMLHEVDLFTTIAAAAKAPEMIPKDRILDGVDQLPFLEGKQENSNRESAIFLNGAGKVMAVKWQDWKLWYHYLTEMPDPEPNNLVRLFDLRVDPREEIDVKDHYPWVIGIMDKIVQDYEASLERYPRVPESANREEPYLPAAVGSGKPVQVYQRTDRTKLPPRSPSLGRPDFTGSWSTQVLHRVSVINRPRDTVAATLGSGWGDQISINHTNASLEVERVVFIPREIQPLLKYRYALDGSTSENQVNTGRSSPPQRSTAQWEDDRLVITTHFPYQNPETSVWATAKMTQTLWLEVPTGTPWEARLIVETEREGVLGGVTTVNRTAYVKGYR